MTQYVTTSSAENEVRGSVVETRMAARRVFGASGARQATAPPAPTPSVRKERRMKTNRIALRHRCNPVTEFARRRRVLSEATTIRKLFTERLARAARLAAFAILAFGSAQADAATWNCSVPPLPTPRSHSVAAVAEDANGTERIYVIGGQTNTVVGTVEAYDPVQNDWTPMASMVGRERTKSAGATASNGKIYIFGGQIGNQPSALVDEYDPVADMWTPKGASVFFTPRWGASAVAAPNGMIYVFGGEDPFARDDVLVYDPANDSWAPNIDMPVQERDVKATLGCDGFIYVFGSGPLQADVWQYEPVLDNWLQRAAMPGGRDDFAVATDPTGKIFVMNGHKAGTGVCDTSDVDVYDPVSDTWSVAPSNCTERNSTCAATLGGYVYSIGHGGTHGGCTPFPFPTNGAVERYGRICAAPPPNMVAWYPGDNTTPYDFLSSFPGMYVGLPVSPIGSKVGGGALEMHSAPPATHVVVANGPNFGTGDFSIDMWIRTASTTAIPGVQPILDKRTAAPLVGYHLALFNGYLLAQLADGVGAGSTNYFNTGNPDLFVADGKWHFVAVTVDRLPGLNLLTLYVDGHSQSFSAAARPNSLTNAAGLLIGARNSSLGGGNFDGLMDEIEFFNRALTPAEVQRIYWAGSAGKCKYCPLCPPPKGYHDVCVGGTNAGDGCAENSDCPGGGACNLKNRFITFEVPETGTSHGILVTLVDLDQKSVATPGNYNGTERWVGPPQMNVSDGVSGSFNAARLQCAFHSQDWGDVGELHIYGDVVVPNSTYDASVCSAEAGPCSAPLRLATAKFGDVITPINTTNFQDVNAVVAKFQGTPAGPSKTRTKLTGSIVNPVNPVNFQEVSACVAAFQSKQFKTVVPAPPATCP